MIVSQATTFVDKKIWSIQECEIKLGIGAKQKQEELEHLGRLLEALQLDKDILTQLKVRKAIFLTLWVNIPFLKKLPQVNLQAKVARKLGGKKR